MPVSGIRYPNFPCERSAPPYVYISMYLLRWVAMTVLSVGIVGGAAVLAIGSGPRAGSPEEEEAKVMVRRLADTDPELREEAEARVRALDRTALPFLRAACGSSDLGLARRARKLLDEIEGNAPLGRE